jgi:hypothetical protein
MKFLVSLPAKRAAAGTVWHAFVVSRRLRAS